jgi:hypothetical protein
MKNSAMYDSSTQLKVVRRESEVTCVLSGTRIIYNIPTIIEVLKMQEEFESLLLHRSKLGSSIFLHKKITLLKRI